MFRYMVLIIDIIDALCNIEDVFDIIGDLYNITVMN